MIEVVGTIARVGEILRGSPDGTPVIGPTIDGGWGITSRCDGSVVHLGIHNIRQSPEGITEGDGLLYLAPIPQGGHPLKQAVEGALPYNCASMDLPDEHSVSPDLFGGLQVVWRVGVTISGLGKIPHEWNANIFTIKPPSPLTRLAA